MIEGKCYWPGRPRERKQEPGNQRDVAGTAHHWDVASSDNKERWAYLHQRVRFRRYCATVSPDNNEWETDSADTGTLHRGCAEASDNECCSSSTGSHGSLRHRRRSNRCPRWSSLIYDAANCDRTLSTSRYSWQERNSDPHPRSVGARQLERTASINIST